MKVLLWENLHGAEDDWVDGFRVISLVLTLKWNVMTSSNSNILFGELVS